MRHAARALTGLYDAWRTSLTAGRTRLLSHAARSGDIVQGTHHFRTRKHNVERHSSSRDGGTSGAEQLNHFQFWKEYQQSLDFIDATFEGGRRRRSRRNEARRDAAANSIHSKTGQSEHTAWGSDEPHPDLGRKNAQREMMFDVTDYSTLCRCLRWSSNRQYSNASVPLSHFAAEHEQKDGRVAPLANELVELFHLLDARVSETFGKRRLGHAMQRATLRRNGRRNQL